MVIRPLKEDRINEVAIVQCESWKAAFKGILSDKLLDQLKVENFEKVWKEIIKKQARSNLIIEEGKKVIGFVSFENDASAIKRRDGELIGMYVHPSYWRLGAGTLLLKQAFSRMKAGGFEKIFLWTMKRNEISCKFYEKSGFRISGEERRSERNGESFQEVRYEMTIPDVPEKNPFAI